MPTAYELEREANIARNKALLEELNLKEAVAQLGLPKTQTKPKAPAKSNAKPVQPAKRKRETKTDDEPVVRRQSTRLRRTGAGISDPNESPSKRRKREKEEEELRRKEEQERLEVEERAREARRPRHQDLDVQTLLEDAEPTDLSSLTATFTDLTKEVYQKKPGEPEAFVYDSDDVKARKQEEREVADLKKKLGSMKIVARAKVTQDRVYSAAYHPDKTKDLIFFGDKHGQLGIWDALAPEEEVEDEDGEASVPPENRESGKYWRLQMHWPATAKSSISCIKFNPADAHNVFTSAYDCTIRSLSFSTGISTEIFSSPEALITSMDLTPTGQEMWIADAVGGLTHLDLREKRDKGRWFGLEDQKIGCVSVNPTTPWAVLTASNSRSLKLWDTRKLLTIAGRPTESALLTPPPSSPVRSSGGAKSTFASDTAGEGAESATEINQEEIQKFVSSKKGKGTLRAEWPHGKSVSAAYWDPRGRRIVSTSYDDTLRLWDVNPSTLKTQTAAVLDSKPFSRIRHNCQTGKWLTILRAQWTPNPDVYPHFTVGNMEHSLDIFSCKGDLIARLSDRQRITAVQAVTCSHPGILERAASGNASGRCVLWAPSDIRQ